MWTHSLKCSSVVFFACAFLAGSGSVTGSADDKAGAFALSSAGAFASSSAGAFASSNAGTLEDARNIPGAQDRHKGIRSYDSTGFPHDSNVNRDVKSYGTPSGHGASYDHGIKGGDHGYNKNADGCSKCKWENDDYWERDEPEKEGDENDGDECDDGQYRPEHHHGPGGRPKSRPSGVHKTGPAGVDDGTGSPSDFSGGINYPATGPGYTRPINGYVTTSKPSSSWNTPFADASKSGYGGVTPPAFGTTPSSWSDWNRRPTPGGSPSKPIWDGGHNRRFPSSQGPGAPAPNFSAMSKPGQGWNQFPSGTSAGSYAGSGVLPPSNYGNPQENKNKLYGQPVPYPASGVSPPSNYGNPQPNQNRPYGQSVPHPASGVSPPSNYGNPQPNQNRLYGQSVPHPASGVSPPSNYGNPQANQNRPYGQPVTQSTYAGAYAGASVTSGVGSPSGEPSNFGRKDHPFGLYKPVNTQTPHGPYTGINQTPSNRDSGYYGLGSYNKPEPSPHSTLSTTVTNTFATTKGPYGRIDSSKTVPGTQSNPFPGKSPGSPTGSGVYEHPSVTKPSGTTSSWLGTGQTGSGSSTWHSTGTTPHIGFPTSNIGFGTTKTPFSHVNTPSSVLTAPYDGTEPKRPNFNFASSSATASAGSNAFPSTPSITGTTSLHGTTPVHRGSNYTPSVKGYIGTRPTYGTVPHGTHPNIGSGTWPSGQPESNIGPWFSGKPGSGITPEGHSPGTSEILPSKQPQGGSGTWPDQRQPGSGSGCTGGNCGSATSQGDSNCGRCCESYNCNSPSGVNKTYYPAGTGDGNVPNIGTVYGPDSRPNIRGDIRPVYPGTQGASTTAENPNPWNPANPFLYGDGGGTPSSFSHPWTGTTDKPLGQGNPFLDSNWNSPKPGYSNVYNDRNVIPHGEGNNKPIGQGNIFLNDNRGEGNLGGPSYGKYPDRSGTPGNYPGSGISGKYPGSGTPENYPGSGTPGSYSGSVKPGSYPEPGIPGNYPGSGIPGTSGNYGAVKGGFHSSGASPQDRNSNRPYPTGSSPQGTLECKLGLFGCGTPGSGSYADDKYPGETFGIRGNVGAGTGNLGGGGNVPSGPGNLGISPVSGQFTASTGHPGAGGSNLATSAGGAQARAYAGAFSSAQASSSSFAGSFSGATGPANNFGNLSPNAAQNQGGLNPWASSDASAFASSSAGSWSGNHPIDVKG